MADETPNRMTIRTPGADVDLVIDDPQISPDGKTITGGTLTGISVAPDGWGLILDAGVDDVLNLSQLSAPSIGQPRDAG